jgi:TonB family protein
MIGRSGPGQWLGGALIALAVAACGPEEPVTDPQSISVDSPFQYPIELWDERVEGETVVMVHVTEMGAVDSVYVQETSGQPAFDSAAVTGARELRFSPGRRGERRVDMWARLPVRFRMPPDSAITGGV